MTLVLTAGMGNTTERGLGAAGVGSKLPTARRAARSTHRPAQGRDLATSSLHLGTLSVAVELLSTEPRFMLLFFAFCICLHNKF